MKKLLAALASVPALAVAQLPQPVRDALARAGVPESAVGAVVGPAGGGARLVSHNADRPLNPASAIKVVTTYAALDLLSLYGPRDRFWTNWSCWLEVAALPAFDLTNLSDNLVAMANVKE